MSDSEITYDLPPARIVSSQQHLHRLQGAIGGWRDTHPPFLLAPAHSEVRKPKPWDLMQSIGETRTEHHHVDAGPLTLLPAKLGEASNGQGGFPQDVFFVGSCERQSERLRVSFWLGAPSRTTYHSALGGGGGG